MAPEIAIGQSSKWIGVIQATKVFSQIVAIVFLARLLAPTDFGLMALSLAVIGFATLFREMGLTAYIIQREDITDSQINSIFWLCLAVGVGIWLIITLAAYQLAELMSQARLAGVLIALAPIFIISALGSVHQATLERVSDFRAIALSEGLGAAVGLCIAILAALRNLEVYALVLQTVSSVTISTMLFWLFSQFRPKWTINLRHISESFHFSLNLFTFNLLNYFQRNIDTLIIGRFFGEFVLGNYNIAYRCILFPLQNITFVFTRAMFPVYSRAQNSRDRIAAHYLNMLQGIAFLTAPMMMIAWSVRDLFVEVVFGEQWALVGDVIFWLAPVGLFQSIVSTSGSLLSALGATNRLRKLGFWSILFLVVPIFLGVPFGIKGVAAFYFLGNAAWTVPVFRVVLSELGLSWRLLVSKFLPALGCGAISVCVLLLAQQALVEIVNNSLWLLIVLVVTGCASYSAAILFLQRRAAKSIWGQVKNLF